MTVVTEFHKIFRRFCSSKSARFLVSSLHNSPKFRMFSWILVPIFISCLIYFAFVRPYRSWRNVPIAHFGVFKNQLKMAEFFLGRRNITLHYDEIYKSYPQEPYVGMYEIRNPVLLIRDSKLVNDVLIKDFEYFQNRGMTPVDEDGDPIEAHLLHLTGKRWKSIRAKVTPLFSPSKLKKMFHFVEACVEELEEHLRTYSDSGQPADIMDIAEKYLTELMGRYTFGLRLNMFKNSNSVYLKLTHQGSLFTLRRLVNILMRWVHPKLVKWISFGTVSPELADSYTNLLQKSIEYNRNGELSQLNFLKQMLDIQDQEKRDHSGNFPKFRNS